MEKEISLCRPDKEHYCIECCTKMLDGNTLCTNIGRLPDGTRGCLSHASIITDKLPKGASFPEKDLCREMSCPKMYSLSKEAIQCALKVISSCPPGEISVPRIIKAMNLVTKGCQRFNNKTPQKVIRLLNDPFLFPCGSNFPFYEWEGRLW